MYQHRGDVLVPYCFCFFEQKTAYEIGSHFGHLLGDEAKGDCLCCIILLVVTKTYGFESIDRFAGFLHRLDIMLIPARRDVGSAKSAAAIYSNKIGIGTDLGLHVRVDLADVAAVAHVLAIDVRANANNAVGRRDAAAGLPAHSRVEAAAGVVKECATTDGGIEVAGGVIGKRVSTDGRVHVAGCVAKERAIAYGSVEVAVGVAKERTTASGSVEAPKENSSGIVRVR